MRNRKSVQSVIPEAYKGRLNVTALNESGDSELREIVPMPAHVANQEGVPKASVKRSRSVVELLATMDERKTTVWFVKLHRLLACVCAITGWKPMPLIVNSNHTK